MDTDNHIAADTEPQAQRDPERLNASIALYVALTLVAGAIFVCNVLGGR